MSSRASKARYLEVVVRRFKAVPWILVLAAARVLWEHWNRVEARDRVRATKILSDSKGLPHKMSDKQRRELVEIARRVDAASLGRDLAAAASPLPVPGLKSRKPGST